MELERNDLWGLLTDRPTEEEEEEKEEAEESAQQFPDQVAAGQRPGS